MECARLSLPALTQSPCREQPLQAPYSSARGGPSSALTLSRLRNASPASALSLRTRVRRTRAAVAFTAQPATAKDEDKDDDEEKEEESSFQVTEDGAEAPNPFEVQSLIMEICDETDIAEFRIKVGDFLLHVKRDLGPAPQTIFAPPAALSQPVADVIAAAPPAAPAVATAYASAADVEDDLDEGLLPITSPSVGILRRAKLVKGNRGRELVEVGSDVKAGQVVCYIQQLNNEVPVESQHDGEVVSFLANDGDAVGFGDAVITVRPFFPGIKKLA